MLEEETVRLPELEEQDAALTAQIEDAVRTCDRLESDAGIPGDSQKPAAVEISGSSERRYGRLPVRISAGVGTVSCHGCQSEDEGTAGRKPSGYRMFQHWLAGFIPAGGTLCTGGAIAMQISRRWCLMILL